MVRRTDSIIGCLFSTSPDLSSLPPPLTCLCQLFSTLHPFPISSSLARSTLISSYSKFLQKTAKQRPDSILATLPKPQTVTWLQWSHKLLRTTAPIAGPVFVAMVIFWALKHYGPQPFITWLHPSNWTSPRNTLEYIAPIAGSLFVATTLLWVLKHYSSHRS